MQDQSVAMIYIEEPAGPLLLAYRQRTYLCSSPKCAPYLYRKSSSVCAHGSGQHCNDQASVTEDNSVPLS